MTNGIEALLAIKDKPDWDFFNEVFHALPSRSVKDCEYRFDKEAQAIFREKIEHRAYYTYIAKAEGYDVYKVGKTRNLKKRIKELGSDFPYSLFRFRAIAYCPRDIEHTIKAWSSCIFRKLPEPFQSASELLLFEEGDINRLISECGFVEITDEAPGRLTVTRRDYFHPDSGKFIITTYQTTNHD